MILKVFWDVEVLGFLEFGNFLIFGMGEQEGVGFWFGAWVRRGFFRQCLESDSLIFCFRIYCLIVYRVCLVVFCKNSEFFSIFFVYFLFGFIINFIRVGVDVGCVAWCGDRSIVDFVFGSLQLEFVFWLRGCFGVSGRGGGRVEVGYFKFLFSLVFKGVFLIGLELVIEEQC